MGILVQVLLAGLLATGNGDSDHVDALLSGVVVSTDPGVAVLVVKGGSPVYQKACGLSDLEKKVPMSLQTRFELASGSKQFTAFAIMILLDRKQLSLEDDVRKHVPELPEWNKDRPIRVTDLLHHTSGIPDHIGTGAEKRVTDQAFLERTSKRKLDFPTGTRFRYTNMGYRLLAMLVERITGKSLGQFLQKEVFEPSGMIRTIVRENVDEEIVNRARGYGRQGPSYRLSENLELVIHGEAGVWTTIEDLIRWDGVLRKNRFVKPETLASAWTSGKLDDGKDTGYGFGWFVEKDGYGRKIHHGGDFPGFATMHLRYPDRGLAVFVLRNLYGGYAKDLASRIASIYLDDPPKEANPAPPVEESRLFAGSYSSRNTGARTTAVVELVKDQFRLAVPGQLPYRLLPLSTTRYQLEFAPSGYVADFKVEKGAVVSLTIEHGKDRPSVTLYPRGKKSDFGQPEPQDLERYAGVYAAQEATVKVTLAAGALTLHVEGQPPYPLKPLSKTRFHLEGLPEGYVADFDDKAVTIEHAGEKPAVTLAKKE